MGVTASLVMWPRCSEQTFVPLNYWGSIWNLALIGPVVSEEKKTFDEFSLYECVKQVTPGAGAIFYPRLQFEYLHRNSQGKATYQISKTWAF